jgi:tetratricopeptide (TPR) repeat protein
LDRRTDLFSFGVVLFEMATGQLPFKGESSAVICEAIMNREPAFPDQLAPGFPFGLKEVIRKALEKDLDLRYQHASDLRGDLHRLKRDSEKSKTLSTSRSPSAQPSKYSSLTKTARIRIVVWTLMGVFLAFGIGATIYLRNLVFLPPFQPLPERPGVSIQSRVAILPFQYVGDESSLGYVAQGLWDDLNNRLMQFRSSAFLIASAADVGKEVSGTNASRQVVAHRLGVNYLIDGKLQEQDRNLRAVLSMYDVERSTVVESTDFSWNRGDLLGLGNRIYAIATKWLKLSDTEGSFRAGMNPAANNLAYEQYLKGRYKEDANDCVTAVGSYQAAVRIEPTFFLAYLGLARCDLSKFRQTKDAKSLKEAMDFAQEAVQLDDLSADAHTTLSEIYWGAKSKERSLGELGRALQLGPNSDGTYRNLGEMYLERRDEQQAISEFQKAVAMNPVYWRNHAGLGKAYLEIGEPAKSLAEFQRVVELAPDNPIGYRDVGLIYLREGKWSESIPQFQKAVALAPDAVTYSNIGTAYFFMRDYGHAVRMYEKAVQLNPNQDEVLWGNLGDGYRWLGQVEEAQAAYKKTIALAKIGSNAQVPETLADIGLVYAKMGDQSRALEYIRVARTKAPSNVQIMYCEGQVYAVLGDPQLAIAAYGRAVTRGYPRLEVLHDPENIKLRSLPEFVKLVGVAPPYAN